MTSLYDKLEKVGTIDVGNGNNSDAEKYIAASIGISLKRIADALEKANEPVIVNTGQPQTLVGEWNLDLEAIRRLMKLAQTDAPNDGYMSGNSKESVPFYCPNCKCTGTTPDRTICPYCKAQLKGM